MERGLFVKNGDIVYVVFGTTVLKAQMTSDFYLSASPHWRKGERCRILTLKRYDIHEGWSEPKPKEVGRITSVPRTNVYSDCADVLKALEEGRQKLVGDYRIYWGNAKRSLDHARREMSQLQRRLREFKALDLEQHFLENKVQMEKTL